MGSASAVRLSAQVNKWNPLPLLHPRPTLRIRRNMNRDKLGAVGKHSSANVGTFAEHCHRCHSATIRKSFSANFVTLARIVTGGIPAQPENTLVTMIFTPDAIFTTPYFSRKTGNSSPYKVNSFAQLFKLQKILLDVIQLLALHINTFH